MSSNFSPWFQTYDTLLMRVGPTTHRLEKTVLRLLVEPFDYRPPNEDPLRFMVRLSTAERVRISLWPKFRSPDYQILMDEMRRMHSGSVMVSDSFSLLTETEELLVGAAFIRKVHAVDVSDLWEPGAASKTRVRVDFVANEVPPAEAIEKIIAAQEFGVPPAGWKAVRRGDALEREWCTAPA